MKITEKKLKKQALDFAKEKLGGKTTIYRTWSEGELLDDSYMETINEIKEEYGYTTREAIQDLNNQLLIISKPSYNRKDKEMKKDFNRIIPDLERVSSKEFDVIINKTHKDNCLNILKLLDQINNKTLELEIGEATRFLENLKNEIKFYNKYNTPNLTFVKDQYKDMVEVVIEINLTDTLYKFKIKTLHLFELDVKNNAIEILKSFDGQTFDLTVNQEVMFLNFVDGIIAKYNQATNNTEILERNVYKIQKNSSTHVIHKVSENKSISECIIKFDII